eukprot:TRINITY_DN64657_c0_g1_i1.p1 TRINITY_DN64657_c0_g1~~TRINITY_DN64657_c0_g1_i1.p1  ORF type:complete len:262 (-),score=50.74 TRINITY_DN64657_c0_g1_i1:126-845(-)
MVLRRASTGQSRRCQALRHRSTRRGLMTEYGAAGRGWWDAGGLAVKHAEKPCKQKAERKSACGKQAVRKIVGKFRNVLDGLLGVQDQLRVQAETLLAIKGAKQRRERRLSMASTATPASSPRGRRLTATSALSVSTTSGRTEAGDTDGGGGGGRAVLLDPRLSSMPLHNGADLPIGPRENGGGHWEWPLSKNEKRARVKLIDATLAQMDIEELEDQAQHLAAKLEQYRREEREAARQRS